MEKMIRDICCFLKICSFPLISCIGQNSFLNLLVLQKLVTEINLQFRIYDIIKIPHYQQKYYHL